MFHLSLNENYKKFVNIRSTPWEKLQKENHLKNLFYFLIIDCLQVIIQQYKYITQTN
jgi:hypothetical protein